MKIALITAGVVLLVIGVVWTGQGANLIGGSFMTGQPLWLAAGLFASAIGAGLIWWSTIFYRRFR